MLSVTRALLPLNHLFDISCSCILPTMSTCNQVHTAGSSFFRVLFSFTVGHCHLFLGPSLPTANTSDPDIPTQTGILALTANEAFCYAYWSPRTSSGPAEPC